MTDVQSIIDRIVNDERFRSSLHFSDRVYSDEPILTTGRQMASYLPDRYREMRSISRWQAGADGTPGRWLSEAELFVRQGTFMADFEDDCPYHGTFKAFYPTYNAMSDRQLRGYFTWRAAVRRGTVEETSLSFAYVYLYELICGIGVADPTDGFARMKAFWSAYRGFAPEIDRYARVWLHDYVVYHGLDPALLDEGCSIPFDRKLLALMDAERAARARADALDAAGTGARTKRKSSASGALLPVDAELEDRLLSALDGLSTYRIERSRYFGADPTGLRHVTCAVFVQLARHYDRNRKNGLVESLFGGVTSLPYTMFASAVFHDPARHPDTVYELDPINRFTCRDGLWTCERVHGSRMASPKLGQILRAVDRAMRTAADYPHPLKENDKTPRYLQQIIDREIAAWNAWKQAHTPRKIDIDLSKLSGIRTAAAETREALLTDEEREGGSSLAVFDSETQAPTPSGTGSPVDAVADAAIHEMSPVSSPGPMSPADALGRPDAADRKPSLNELPARQTTGLGAPTVASERLAESSDSHALEEDSVAVASRPAPHAMEPDGTGAATREPAKPRPSLDDPVGSASPAAPASIIPASGTSAPQPDVPAESGAPCGPLSAQHAAYLRALLAQDDAAAAQARAGTSEDLLVDAINEALFDLIGDTAVEFGDTGPHVVDDYREDIEELIHP